jgi:[acyl-carrier-protein] S-malonyltransferase
MSTVAFIFPGQGSQKPGMGRDFYDNFKTARHVLEEGSDALSLSLPKLIFESDEASLKLTENTQPAVLAVSVMILRVLVEETELRPSSAAGHSLGEYSALVAAGVFKFADALRAVRSRGRFMQEAVAPGEGGMVALIGLTRKEVEEVCRLAVDAGAIEPANFNSPGQIVISGHANALKKARKIAKEMGAKMAIPLPVSAPFHSSLMQPAADRLSGVLEEIEFQPHSFPIYTNVEAQPNQDSARVKELLVRQVTAPVLWEDTVNRMKDDGITATFEIGPGDVLTGLVRRTDSGIEATAINSVNAITELAG